MNTQYKLNHYYQKYFGVIIYENLFFVNQKYKYTSSLPSIKPVFTVISSELTEYVIDYINVKVFYTEKLNYVDSLKMFYASIYVLNNKRTVGSLEYIHSSEQVDKTDVFKTIHDRC